MYIEARSNNWGTYRLLLCLSDTVYLSLSPQPSLLKQNYFKDRNFLTCQMAIRLLEVNFNKLKVKKTDTGQRSISKPRNFVIVLKIQ